MPSITARMPAFWDPREVLSISPAELHFSCTAIVKPKKKGGQPQEPPRRCLQTFLSSECKNQACRVFDALAQIDVVSVGVSGDCIKSLISHKLSKWALSGVIWLASSLQSERRSRRRAERERLRALTTAEPRAVPEQYIQRHGVPSAPDLEDSEMRLAARRARERRQQAPEVPPQFQPREPREQQLANEGHLDRARDAHYPRQVQVDQVEQQPLQDFAPRLLNQDNRNEEAVLAALGAGRRSAQLQADARPVPNQDQLVARDRASHPSPVQRSETIPDPAIDIGNRQLERRSFVQQPAEVLGRRPATALPPSIQVQPVEVPVNGEEEDQLQHLINRRRQLCQDLDRVQEQLRQHSPQAPEIPVVPGRDRAPESEIAQFDQAIAAIAAPPPRQRRAGQRAVPLPDPVHPYVPRRQPLVECYICYEPFGRVDDVIWCQGQCGQNVHRECFETWQLHSMYAIRKCGFCRAPWVENR
ncbi:hypothetical protein BKA64DRAFT_645798 [Cadophora sp. MPI-SDFR-AT-0126]|nr:hypothetical protein BKA64DRAFT_645798 [Leotiomycetes sp. MPI-SDFR-AT-0126]